METVTIKSIRILGIAMDTDEENYKKDSAELWNTFLSQNIIEKIPGKINSKIYCVYTNYKNDAKNYTVMLGCEISTSLKKKDFPAEMISKTITGGQYKKYIVTENIFNVWEKIHNAKHRRIYTTDFEVYEKAIKNSEAEIFVAINNTKEEQFIEAIDTINAEKMTELIAKGIDINYGFYTESNFLKRIIKNSSSPSLTKDNLNIYADVAKMLIEKGADSTRAIEFAFSTYKNNPSFFETPFTKVYDTIVNAMDRNKQLIKAISYGDIRRIQFLLENGADANYKIPEEEYEGMVEYKYQPYSPLRLVMFCISDALITDEELKEYIEIVKILIAHGADPKPAMELAEERYGKYNPTNEDSLFMDVWKVVADAYQKQIEGEKS